MKRIKISPGILVLLVVLLVGSPIALKTLWTKPLSTALAIPTLPPNAPAAVFQTSNAQNLAQSAAPEPTIMIPSENVGQVNANIPESVKQPICDGPETMTILAIGIDYRSEGNDYLYGLGDVIRIVRIDFTKPSVSMLAIPRDLKVYIPGLENKGIGYGKINQAYFWGTPGMGYYDGQAGGAGLLADTLYYNFGLYPDHYVVVSMHALEKMIDAVGGIDVTLEKPVDGNIGVDKNGFYGVGLHHFNGPTAVLFGRIREGYSDLDRIDNQTIVLNALYSKVMSDEIRPKLLQILADFILSNTILTDFSPADLPMFLCAAQDIERKDIKVATLPSDTFKAETLLSSNQKDYVFYFIPDIEKIIGVIGEFKQGIWP